MDIGGIDISAIDLDNSDFVLPEVVQGRVLNADGDIYAYNCSGTDDTTHEEVVFNLKAEVKGRMKLTGSTDYVLHLTGDGSDKGQRYSIAHVKEYQANRKDKPKPKNLAFARKYIQEHMKSEVHYDQEADDGMAQAQQKCIDAGKTELSVIDSTDKDLRMVAGLHLCPETHTLVEVNGYGSSWYDVDKKKVLGWGTSFFWHQMLMGDTADNIPGLPAFGKLLSSSIWPSSALREQHRRITEGTMPSGKQCSAAQLMAAQDKYKELLDSTKNKPCGPAAAAQYLKDAKDDFDAYRLVLQAYTSYYGPVAFVFEDYRGYSSKRSVESMILEQGILLWMRRYKDIKDVSKFFQEIQDA